MESEEKRREHTRLAGILYAALSEPLGLFVLSNSPVKARLRLYAARAREIKEGRGAGLETLRFMLSPVKPNQVVILRGDLSLPAEEPPDEEPSDEP